MISGYGHTFERMKEGPAPSAGAVANAMERALETACLRPQDIDLILAHGDGSVLGDRSEAEAISLVFGKKTGSIPVFSSKASLGNLFAGAPAADVILGIQMIGKGIIPAMIHDGSKSIHQGAGNLGLIVGKPLVKDVRRVMVNCQSYEGQASSIIIEAIT